MWSAITAALVLLGALVGFGGWASAGVAAGASPWAYAAAFVLGYAALVLALTLTFFALAWIWRSPRPHDARIGPAGTARLLWNEYAALLGASPRMILYRLLVPDDPPTRSPAPVLLVHGVLCNAGVWTSMRRRLATAGAGPLHAISYGPPLASIERFAGQLAAKIDAILDQTGARDVALVTHSMGGQLVYDALTAFAGDVYGGMPRVDLWCASASQIGLFAELGMFVAEGPPSVVGVPADRLGYLWNAWSSSDVLSFRAEGWVAGAHDTDFTFSGSLGANHMSYLTDPTFYRTLAAKVRAHCGPTTPRKLTATDPVPTAATELELRATDEPSVRHELAQYGEISDLR